MALEEHELKQLEENFERLDNKLKATFSELEHRMSEIKSQPVGLEEHIQELEDLILLLQLEITKVKEKTQVATEYLTPEAPSMAERLDRLEEIMHIKQPKREAEVLSGEEIIVDEPGEGPEETRISEIIEPQMDEREKEIKTNMKEVRSEERPKFPQIPFRRDKSSINIPKPVAKESSDVVIGQDLEEAKAPIVEHISDTKRERSLLKEVQSILNE